MFKKLMVAVICFAASTGHAFSVDLNKSHGIVGALATGGTLLLVYAGPYVYKRGRSYCPGFKSAVKGSVAFTIGVACNEIFTRFFPKSKIT